jgi:hypothetical protein
MPKPASEPSRRRVRGVWTHPGFFGADRVAMEKDRRNPDQYNQSDINTLFVLVKNTSGYLYYASVNRVVDPAYDWDFSASFLPKRKNAACRCTPVQCFYRNRPFSARVRQHPNGSSAVPG